MHPLESYLRELREIRATGAAQREVSYYPALSALVSELGKSLSPRVRCVMPMADQGAGMPDGGLFTA
ncbi:MAG: DNA methyltransferase, partial [Gammaproteobacteria bacterium]